MNRHNTFGTRINLEFRNGHLEADDAHDSPQLKYAKRMLATGEEHIYRLRRPWSPLLPKRIINWLLQDRTNVLPVLQKCVELGNSWRVGRPRRPANERPTRKAELPAELDPNDEHYERQAARLRYARNALLIASPGEVVVGRFLYHTEQLGQITLLLRPWYAGQWDRMTKVIDERRERYLERMTVESAED